MSSQLLNALPFFMKNRIPGQLIIQLTDRCNARCPQCGMRVNEKFKRSRLSNDDVKKIIDAAAEKGVTTLSFTGGEPLLLLDDLTSLIRYASAAGIRNIRTGTNGFFLAQSHKPEFEKRIHRIAESLAGTALNNFWISIDSAVPEIHDAMRGFEGLIPGIEKALPVFHACGLYPTANLGLNRNLTEKTRRAEFCADRDAACLNAFFHRFTDGLRAFYRQVIDMGFTIANNCYPMSIEGDEEPDSPEAVYAASSQDRVVYFHKWEKIMLLKVLSDIISEFRSEIRIFTPRTSLYALLGQYGRDDATASYPCRGGIDFFFISAADGNTYPCGYLGRRKLGPFPDLNLKSLNPEAECRKCDWQCFRDPAELLGPVLQCFKSPLTLVRRIRQHPEYFRFWRDDLRYYRACDFFDGRKNLDSARLSKFQPHVSAEKAEDPMRTLQKELKAAFA